MATRLFGPVITTRPGTPPGRKTLPSPFTCNKKKTYKKKKLHPQLFLGVRWPSYFLVGWKWKIQHPQPGVSVCAVSVANGGIQQNKQLPKKKGGAGG